MRSEHHFPLAGKRVWVAGHSGMVGAALVRRLQSEACEILTVTRREVDLRRQLQTEQWIEQNRPDAIILAAAKVGGILANDRAPADFLADNLQIEMNIIGAARQFRTPKLLFLGSSCIYPKLAPQPISEDMLMTGPLEPTNEWYAIAKIAGMKLAEACRRQDELDFISAMPTNLYGPQDNFDLNSSHVIPALIRKAHEAKVSGQQELIIWGTGRSLREFLHVDDCADALVLLLKTYSAARHINVGSGRDISIGDLAREVANVVGFKGEISFDHTKPDGMPRKLMSADQLRAMGWNPRISLTEGLADTYSWFLRYGAAALEKSTRATVLPTT
jgi:GDP-L-fucose synthase